jgi:transcriptional regulator with XRE-family HTH domain
MNSQKAFGEIVRQRQALKLTQSQLARKLGIEGSHVAYLEKGQRRPCVALVARLAELLELDGSQLFLFAYPEARSLIRGTDQTAHAEDPGKAWQRFARARDLHVRYHITRREIHALRQLTLLGYALTELDFMAVLALIRN